MHFFRSGVHFCSHMEIVTILKIKKAKIMAYDCVYKTQDFWGSCLASHILLGLEN